MKIKNYATIFLLSLFVISCSVVDKLLTFTISNSTSIQIDSNLPLGTPFEISTPDVSTNSSSEFENNKTKANLVKEVKLKDLKLTITDPTDKNFSFLKSVHLYISTDADDEIELAYLDDINTIANTIELISTDAKLDEYIKASSYKIRTEAVLKETVTSDVTIKADMNFRVTADPF